MRAHIYHETKTIHSTDISIFTKSSPTSSHRSDEVGSNRKREANIGTEIRSETGIPNTQNNLQHNGILQLQYFEEKKRQNFNPK